MPPPDREDTLMKAIQVNYDSKTEVVTVNADAASRDWQDVCETYDDDVHRVRDVDDHPGYSGLYVCYDKGNQPHHFLVAEDAALQRLRRRTFLKKLGK
jgi:hypothetical protein